MHFVSRRIALRAGLALLGVALFCGYALAPSLAFLPYVALVPWTILYMDPRRPTVSPVYFLAAGYVCWILCHASTFRFGWLVPLAMALCFLPAWLLFPLLVRPIQRLGLPRSITLPVVWVTVEWARLLLASAHFDLFALGYSQARFTPLVQIADITGVYGVSFLVAAVNGLLADAWFTLKGASFRPRILRRERQVVVPAMALASAFACVLGYGFYRLASPEATPGPRLAVVQPRIAHVGHDPLSSSLLQLYQTDEGVAAGSVDLIVWPENAIEDDIDRQGAYRDDLAWLASRKHAQILLGAQGRAEGLVGRTTNSAFLLDETGAVSGRYDKQLLFPFVEYVPLDRLVGIIDAPAQRAYRRFIRRAWGFLSTGTPGRTTTLFALPFDGGTIPFAALISTESSYPPLAAEAGRRGARFLVNLTSDDEVGGVIQEQLLRVSILRAVENRIDYVRAGNTGISAIIDGRGRIRAELRAVLTSAPGVLTETVALPPVGPTVYAASHDAFALLCVALTLWLLARALLRGPATMTPHPVPATATVGVVLVAFMLHGCGASNGTFSRTCPDERTCREALETTAAQFRASGAAADGLSFFERVMATYPALEAEARVHRAYFLERCGDTAAALGEYQVASKSTPSSGTFVLLGNLRARLGDAPGALNAYRAARELAPNDPAILVRIARTEWELNDGEDACEAAQDALALAPEHAEALTLLAKIELSRGLGAEAESSLVRAARSDPKNRECRYELSRLAWRAGRHDEARRWLDELRSIEAARTGD